MIKLRTFLSRAVAGFLAVSIIAIGLYAPVTAPKAHAQIVTVEANPVMLANIFATSIATFDQTFISKVLNGLAWTVAKAAIQSMTKSIVNWINSGFNGSPAFETDMKESLLRLGDGVAQNFLTQLANESAVHSPFMDNLITNVGAGYYLYTGRDALKTRLRYTLAESAADDKAFLAGDFQQGGWNAWFSAFMEPANNPYGAQMIASQELASAISNKATAYTQELGWGSGFLSWKGDCIKDSDGTTAVALAQIDKCQDYAIKTPGSVIEQTLIPNLNSPLHQLEIADSINEIVGALAQQLVSKVLGGGGLGGVSQPTQGGGRSYLDQSTDSSQTNSSSLSSGFAQSITSSKSQVEGYRFNWQALSAAANGAKDACRNDAVLLADPVQKTIDDALVAERKAASALSALTTLSAKIDATSNTTSSSATSLAAISNEYSALLSEGVIPTTDEIVYATNQRQDTGTESPASLYTQLTYLASHSCKPIGL